MFHSLGHKQILKRVMHQDLPQIQRAVGKLLLFLQSRPASWLTPSDLLQKSVQGTCHICPSSPKSRTYRQRETRSQFADSSFCVVTFSLSLSPSFHRADCVPPHPTAEGRRRVGRGGRLRKTRRTPPLHSVTGTAAATTTAATKTTTMRMTRSMPALRTRTATVSLIPNAGRRTSGALHRHNSLIHVLHWENVANFIQELEILVRYEDMKI